MRSYAIMFVAFGLAVSVGGSALAQDAADPATLTCNDYLAMDDTGKTAAFEVLTNAALEAGTPASEVTPEEQMASLDQSCANDGDVLALDALKAAPAN